MHDVVIVGGGPGGLAAALTLGRARKRVLLCDAGPRRNALAVHVYNFVTRDGTPPGEFRRIAREQLAAYPTVEILDEPVAAITGERNAFQVQLAASAVSARRVLLATGMVDDMLPIAGFRELWGHAIFQCPYCHGYEVRDQDWGFLALPETASHALPFAMMIRGWARTVTVFTNGAIAEEVCAPLVAAGLRVERAPIARLAADGRRLAGIELGTGETVACDVLFTQPTQRQVPLVQALSLALDEHGYVVVDPMKRETSRLGIYASGDLTSRMQAAIVAAGAGMQTAAMINVDLAMDSTVTFAPGVAS
jgi:thioredoxin reductase